ncbi:MAG TPA: outer membrane protein assembly factor BamA [Rhizomicrobium sp.]|jgi:outer membrane protein insertion porin family|nr:outer membrane protein assembly factor BamA [Rhizomicrobium sp.]
MSLIAFPFAQSRRAAVAAAWLTLVAAAVPAIAQNGTAPQPTPAQVSTPPGPTATTAASVKPGAVIQHIVVEGAQRVEPATVLSYVSVREGEPYDEAAVDRSLKTLFATGLFADVKFNWDGSTLTIHVVENPILNQVVFEGNDKVSDKDLNKEVQEKPRSVFTRAKVQADVQRIIELYRRNGKFAATVDPQIIQRPQNRVDLIFAINEGPTTGVARISFIGNKHFNDDTLREQIATEESKWWRLLSSNDNYDPDRLTFDREQLRRFYLQRGYADFRVVSAVAELTPDRENFYITFTVDEGDLYRFGKVIIDSKIKELTPQSLRPLVPIVEGSTYNAQLVDKSIDALTNAAGTKGYAFAEIHPRIKRNHDARTIDVVFDVQQGPRVYIEKINIVGNSRTLDKVIRREFRLVEGDAFNRVLVDRSRTRIKALGYFKDVDIKPLPGSQPDRTVLQVNVTEQSTGELQLGAGYSSTSSVVGQFSYTERNLFGRGQYLRASIEASSISKEAQVSFTEPYFMDRPLAAGVDIYKIITNYQQVDYQGDTTALGFRMGFPTSEFGSVGLRYTISVSTVSPFANAPTVIQEAAGSETTSAFGYSYSYNTLDDPIKPRRGYTFEISQDFAGFGGNTKYIRTLFAGGWHHPMFWDEMVGTLSFNAGYIQGWNGEQVRLIDRFYKGGDTFRGFALAGVGPREISSPGANAIGGDSFAIGTADLRLPEFLPADYGVALSLFTDFGTVGHLSSGIPPNNCATYPPGVVCIKDNMAFRASAGLGVNWKSPFGPIQISFAIPYIKQHYDRSEIIYFSAGTGL